MSIIAKIPVSPPQFHVIVRESDSGYTVERNNVFMPARVASSHADREEAISAAHKLVEEIQEKGKKYAPIINLIRQRIKTMGVEGALEYYESLGKKYGFSVTPPEPSEET